MWKIPKIPKYAGFGVYFVVFSTFHLQESLNIVFHSFPTFYFQASQKIAFFKFHLQKSETIGVLFGFLSVFATFHFHPSENIIF